MSALDPAVAEWLRYLQEIGVRELYLGKRTVAAPSARESLDAIRQDLGDCTRCKLHGGRTKLVFGVGNPQARGPRRTCAASRSWGGRGRSSTR